MASDRTLSAQRQHSTMMSPPQLPLDVLDDIVDHLHNDSGSLSPCSLVCKAFLMPSRKRLFRVIYLNSPDGDSTDSPYRPFHNYLIAYPQLVGYIQELWVNGKDRIIEEVEFRALLTLFAMSGSLRVFSIKFSPKSSGYGDWNELPIAFREPLCKILCSPSLHTLRIHLEDMCACTFPVDLLTTAPNVKRLTLLGKYAYSCLAEAHTRGTDFDAHAVAAVHGNKTSKPLEVLEIGGVDGKSLLKLFNDSPSCYQLSSLRKIVVAESVDSSFLSGMSIVLQGAACNLEILVWLNACFEYNLEFEQLTNLRTIVFKMNLAEGEFQHLYRLLEAYTAVPYGIENLAIICDDDVPYSSMFHPVGGSVMPFEIDNRLVGLFDWHIRLLRTFTIYVVSDSMDEAEDREVNSAGLRARFPDSLRLLPTIIKYQNFQKIRIPRSETAPNPLRTLLCHGPA
ncbi:hypothetical protein FPV67DRAFT_964664 [Lyophyllum atratum]|nr:hypothetical protein FPV67DRAFT_964664 [Lyophyllum atratum]